MKKLVGFIAVLAILLIAGCPVEVAPRPEDPPGKKVEALLIGDWHIYPNGIEYTNPPYLEISTALEISKNHIKIYKVSFVNTVYGRSFVSETDCYTEDSVLYSADGTKLYEYYQKPLSEYQREYDEAFEATRINNGTPMDYYYEGNRLKLAEKLGGQIFFSIVYENQSGPIGLWKNNNPK